jgi:hypothetical protein
VKKHKKAPKKRSVHAPLFAQRVAPRAQVQSNPQPGLRAPRRQVRASGGGMQLYANPYDTSARGFYFDSMEDYEAKYEKNLPVEEYEIDFIDGTKEQAAIFNAAKINQANLAEWFEVMDSIEDFRLPALFFLMTYHGEDFSEAVSKAEELSFSEGDAKAYAEQLVDDQGGLEHLDRQTLENHFDWDSYVTELETGGGITEFEFAGTTYTADPNSV